MSKNSLGYFVDQVSEDTFYENLLLGLPKVLDKLPNIRQKKLHRFPPVSKSEIRNWENRNDVSLPRTLHDLYLSCNGLLYTYAFVYEPTNRDYANYNKLFAKIEINPIASLSLIHGYETKEVSRVYLNGCNYKIDLSEESRVFELANNENYKVTLVYVDQNSVPTIWIYYDNKFYFISNDISTYLKMAIAHLGTPYWEFVFTPIGLPGRSKEMLNVLAPGVLYEYHDLINSGLKKNHKLNVIDPEIFEKVGKTVNSNNNNNEIAELKKTEAIAVKNENSSSTKAVISQTNSAVARRLSTMTIGRKTSSLVSSQSEKIKRKLIRNSNMKRRPFTPRL